VARPSTKCALTLHKPLCVGCVQARVSDQSLLTLPSPIPELQPAPLPLKGLWAKERAPTPPYSAALLGLTFESLEELGVRHLVLGWTMGKLRLTRLTTAQTWGKPSPSPLYYTLCLATMLAFKWHFVPKVKTPMNLEAYNFVCRTLMETMSKAKLQPSSRAFQQYVACHLHAKNSKQFPTFNGRKSNYQFDSRPFFWT